MFLRFDWRCFVLLRFGLLMMKVPLPTYSALYSLSPFVVSNVDVVSANVCIAPFGKELTFSVPCSVPCLRLPEDGASGHGNIGVDAAGR